MRHIFAWTMALPIIAISCAATAAGEACPDAPSEFVVLSDVGVDLTLLLGDGRRISLPGLEAPRVTILRPERPQELRLRLMRELSGTTIGLAALGSRDRWGNIPAIVFAEEGTLAEMLLARGDVRMRPDPVLRPCRAILLQAEARARESLSGVWSDGALRVVELPASGDTNLREVPTEGLIVVEGTVASVGETTSRVYLNLEKRRGGFAISMPKRDIALMQGETVRKAREVGTRLRVRGLVDRGTGLRIDVSDADALEIVAFKNPSVLR